MWKYDKPITRMTENQIFDIELKANTLMDTYFDKGDGDCHDVGCPLICIIHGPGGCGKDEFIHQVRLAKMRGSKALKNIDIYSFSTVTTVKRACELMVGHNPEKTDRYRQFLHEVKMSWEKLYDGPNQQVITSIRRVITQMCNDKYTKGYNSLIFVHNRDSDSITSFMEDMHELGLPVILIQVRGRTQPEDYKNDCDREPSILPRNITIENDWDLDKLAGEAKRFLTNASLFIRYILPAFDDIIIRSYAGHYNRTHL